VLTALKERGTTLASRYAAYLSVDPRIAQRAAVRAMVAVVLVAVVASWASFLQRPMYEASTQVWVDEEQRDRSTNLAVSGEEIQTEGLPQVRIDIPEHRKRLHELILVELPYAIDSRPVAEEAIQRLELEMTRPSCWITWPSSRSRARVS